MREEKAQEMITDTYRRVDVMARVHGHSLLITSASQCGGMQAHPLRVRTGEERFEVW